MKFILIIIICMISSYSYGCDCDGYYDSSTSKAIFVGTVVGIKKTKQPFVRYEITFEIIKSIKGEITNNTITIATHSLFDGACGFLFEIDLSYAVFVFPKNGMLYTDACTLTTRVGG